MPERVKPSLPCGVETGAQTRRRQLVCAAQLAHDVLRGMPLPTSHVFHRPFQPTIGATGL
jgi:hypothetical protein